MNTKQPHRRRQKTLILGFANNIKVELFKAKI